MIIALDIGGTKIATALVDGTDIVERRSATSTVLNDLAQLLPTISSLCQDWIKQADGVGVACTGRVGDNEVHFLAAGADKIVPLKAQLFQEFGLPVVMLNDAWAAAWAEYCLGNHTDAKTLVYITVSTGIGGGVIQNGKLLTSSTGFAAHLGHVTVPRANGNNLLCTCGRLNCAEAVASGSAIGRRASQLLGREVSCRDVFTLIDSCPELDPLLDDCATAVAELIANVTAMTGTDVVVMGGSVGLAEGFASRVCEAIAALPDLYQVKLCSPALGSDADLVGAALAIQDKLKQI
ncbi:MAG: ROK family protein [Pseudomonadales bacterium]